MENRVQNRANAVLVLGKLLQNLGLDISKENREKCKDEKRFADPQKVKTDGVENVPVRFTDKRESVGIIAEQKQESQKDMRAPERKRYKDQILPRSKLRHFAGHGRYKLFHFLKILKRVREKSEILTREHFLFRGGMLILDGIGYLNLEKVRMISILFVCHGNICRSPMAEFVMKKIVADAGLDYEFCIESAATSAEEIGNPVYPPARKMLQKHGICSDGKTARQMTAKDLETFDYVILMDENNLRNLKWILARSPFEDLNISKDPWKRRLQKVSLLMDYTDKPREVADPWYTGDFQATWDDVWEGCSGLLEFLKPHFSK
ncbi:MAG: low molecular weight phosphotyrosine protein phosphatase [Hallerella succinigenes]|nr:low molecular weight phosphotyrosine protein phosphatase [Hallerella succinigenes]